MTQSDVQARNSSEKGASSAPGGRRRLVGIAAAVGVLAAIAGVTAFAVMNDDEPSSSKSPDPPFDPHASFLVGEPPTGEQVQGVWRVDNGAQVWLFHQDGTFGFTEVGNIYTTPSLAGTWTLSGEELTLTATSTTQDGCIGDFFRLRASIPEPGLMRFVQTDVSTAGCSPISPRQGVLEHLLPAETSTDLVFSTVPGFEPLTDRKILPGFWLAEGGGYGLELNKNGEYVVADESALPVDHGSWSYVDGDLVLTSDKSSSECDAGDRLVLSGVQWVNPGTDAIRGRTTQNACGVPWTPAAWFLIPDSGS